MDDAQIMGFAQGGEDLSQHVDEEAERRSEEARLERERRLLMSYQAQVLAEEELHDEVGLAVVRSAEVVDGDAVGVVELACCSGLGEKPDGGVLFRKQVWVNDLDGDGSPEHCLLGSVDAAHAAHSNQIDDVIAGRQRGSDEAILGVFFDCRDRKAARGAILAVGREHAATVGTGSGLGVPGRTVLGSEVHGGERLGQPRPRVGRIVADLGAGRNEGSIQRFQATRRRFGARRARPGQSRRGLGQCGRDAIGGGSVGQWVRSRDARRAFVYSTREMAERFRLGQLLIDTRMITEEQLEMALEVQRRAQDEAGERKLGEILVDLGILNESQVTQVLSQQLSMPWVALQHIDFSRQLLNLVPAEIAERHGIVPIYVRRARNRQETLYVAMQDPLDLAPLKEIEAHSGLPVRPMIAPTSDLRAAVRAYYLGLPPEEELENVGSAPPPPPGYPRGVSLPPPPPGGARPETPTKPVPAPPPPLESAPSPPPVQVTPTESVPAPDIDEEVPPSGQPVASRGAEMPKPRAVGPKMVTVTMLDGTEIRLPAAGRQKRSGQLEAPPQSGLTARDLIDALRAQAKGADASEVLGADVNWEKMFAALLSLLLKKHLITDWEFVRELKR